MARPVDFSRSFVGFWWSWGLPLTALLATGLMWPELVPAVWPFALVWIGVACSLNARRCHRRHCYITGPAFLIAAVVATLFGSGAIDAGETGWQILGVVLLAVFVVSLIPEMMRGACRR